MQTDDLRLVLRSHMPQLDALRGFAILWVILHNVSFDGIGPAQGPIMAAIYLLGNTGWIGVQLFFVLSGFLITGILLDGRGTTHHFRNFYARRTLRIFPLYYGFLLLVFVILPWTGLVSWLDSTPVERFWYWSYLTNWGMVFEKHVTFPHLWSLAIEEQYYLLWPLLAFVLSKRTLAYICLALIVSAPLCRAYLMFHFDVNFSTDAMYTFTVARWDALAIGSLLALSVRSERAFTYIQRYLPRVFVLLSVLLLAQIGVMRNFSATHYQGIVNQTTIALWFAMLILISIVSWRNPLDRIRPVFSNGFLRWIGKYSYAIYIFHFPAKMFWYHYFGTAEIPNAPWRQVGVVLYNFIGISGIATVVAYVSWHVLEHPFLKLKRYFVVVRKPAITPN